MSVWSLEQQFLTGNFFENYAWQFQNVIESELFLIEMNESEIWRFVYHVKIGKSGQCAPENWSCFNRLDPQVVG